MSRIPKIDTALRNFEDSLEGVTTPGEVYERIDQLRTDIENACEEILAIYAPDDRLIEGPLGANDPEEQ